MPIRTIITIIACLVATTTAAGKITYGPYHADLERVVDGDTVKVVLHLYPGLEQRVSLRLKGINTPEHRPRFKCHRPDGCKALKQCEKEAARQATAFTHDFLNGRRLVVRKVSNGKYAGRVTGHITADGKDLAEALVAAGHARPYKGGKRGWWCEEQPS